jgi:hypothetical protein
MMQGNLLPTGGGERGCRSPTLRRFSVHCTTGPLIKKGSAW